MNKLDNINIASARQVSKISKEIHANNNAEIERQKTLDQCTYETRDLLQQIYECTIINSINLEKQNKIQTKRFIITTVIGIMTLLAAIIVPFLVA